MPPPSMATHWGPLLAIVLAARLALAAEPSSVLVEDWSRQPEGHVGIPHGWTRQSWGSPKYDFTVVTDGGVKVLHLKSQDDNSTIHKAVKVDVKRLPILEWRWKVVRLPAGADARRRESDDQAAQIYITFPRFPSAVRSRIIGYIWDTAAPADAVIKSQSSGSVTYIVAHSGTADVGRWITETRNVYEDYRRIYGEEPAEDAQVVSVAIDSNDTHSHAESYVGEIRFRTP